MFIKYIENFPEEHSKQVNEKINPVELIRTNFKIQNEIPRKIGVELVLYNVDDAIKAFNLLKNNFKTSIRDNSIFIYF